MAAVKTSTPGSASASRRARAVARPPSSALLAAAVDCLVELGYQGTTTAEISRRAGVSPGLFVRYWPTKQALLAAAAAHAQREAMARFEQTVARDVRRGRPTCAAGLRDVISAIIDLHAQPEMRCLAELAHAARTDRELAAEVRAATGPIDDFVLRSARRLAPPEVLGPQFDARVLLVARLRSGVARRTVAPAPSAGVVARAEAASALVAVLGLTG